MCVDVFVGLSGSPPTYTNRPCEWLVKTIRQLTIEIGL